MDQWEAAGGTQAAGVSLGGQGPPGDKTPASAGCASLQMPTSCEQLEAPATHREDLGEAGIWWSAGALSPPRTGDVEFYFYPVLLEKPNGLECSSLFVRFKGGKGVHIKSHSRQLAASDY